MEYLEDSEENYNELIESIKQNNLSRCKFPKLIIGTGLSAIYKLPGMWELANELEGKFDKHTDCEIQNIWNQKKADIFKSGLEAGLSTINLNNKKEREFVIEIKNITSRFILNREIKLMDEIYSKQTGFKSMLKYLKNTASCNNGNLDIMTLNYDRTIEIVCDSLKIGVVTGFTGNLICHFNDALLRKLPKKDFNVRLFKPHGSLNWIQNESEIIKTNDNLRLLKNYKDIHIITPGSSKYEMCTTNFIFNIMRENFDEILIRSPNYSLLIFGYGFNDEHFNVTLYSKFNDVPTLIISKYVKEEVINKGLTNSNLTILFEENGENYIIYKKKKYLLKNALWDINVFANIFFE